MPNQDSATQHTAQSIAAIIAKNIEPATADEVLAALRALEGHHITPRLLDRLPGGRVEWRLRRELGVTEIRNRAFLNDKATGVSLTLARNDSDVLSAEFVERENPEHFKNRRDRNARREQALSNVALLERVALLFNELTTINEQRRLAMKQLAVFISHEGPLGPDKRDLERALGLRFEDKE
jgi:hypothetical protein